jgi:hypothetical protein
VSQILTILRHFPALEFPLSADNILSKSLTLERHASDDDRLVVATLLFADLIHPQQPISPSRLTVTKLIFSR